MFKALVALFLLLLSQSTASAQTATDIDGNSYPTLAIGTQTWLGENLKTTRFANGGPIPTTLLATNNDPSSIYQWAYADDTANIATYGRLYTWYAVADSRHLCPTGWHVPNDTEINILSTFLGGDSLAGNLLKEAGTAHWTTSNSSVTNSTGFAGLPGGFRANGSGYVQMGSNAEFWSATPLGTSTSFQRGNVYRLQAGSSALNYGAATANCGLSVRCVQDAAAGVKNPDNGLEGMLFPNPARAQFTVSVGEEGVLLLSLYNASGMLVLSREIAKGATTVDILPFAAGNYWVLLRGKWGTSVQRLVIQ